jgi:type II restriction/modification system DNA methylase subunit YeeA
MTPQQFIAKWQRASLSERSACQQHFLDLCELLDQRKPAEADPEGSWYTFEKGVETSEDKQGWADVWMRDHFGWEYKGKHKDLKAAYRQLQLYREALENPPLLVVCDMDRFEVHTNFTGTAKQVHAFDLAGLATPGNLDILRRVFADPGSLKPGITSEAMTVEAAQRFAKLADGMRQKGVEPLRAAHFLMKLMFSMFGEKTGLLPPGLFGKLLDTGKANPAMLPRLLQALFEAMAQGGVYGSDIILWFNGGLFADADVLPLTMPEINTLANINKYDWASVEPSIFGTLFERTLDPAKRSQIGAHYTSRADIETLLKPVLLAPLQREWAEVKRKCEAELWPKVVNASRAGQRAPMRSIGRRRPTKSDTPARKAFDRAILDFSERLAHVGVLDPACGSGNFLYVAIHMLLDLEKEVITYASDRGLSPIPRVNPAQLHGLEINPYAQQLAQVVIWIGYLQWMHFNGFKMPDHPVLTPIESIKQMDAILDLTDPEHPKEPEWPEAEFIVGNPPFLGGSKIWEELGRGYQAKLWAIYAERLPGFSDLCCYWFEKARRQIEEKKCHRAGLLATQSIRGGANREVLKRIKASGDIFFAISDRDWILDGATVHISMIGFDDGGDKSRCLNGGAVAAINPNLTTNADTTSAKRLAANQDIAYIGTKKAGPFNIEIETAIEWLRLPNPHGKPNSDVLKPWINGSAIVQRTEAQWIIDPGTSMSQEDFACYEVPYQHSLEHVKPQRDENKRAVRRDRWWLHAETCPAMRRAVVSRRRYLATPRVSKFRIFVWAEPVVICDDGVFVFAQDADWFMAILHSRVHEVWARAQGTQVRERESGFRYTPTTCFENFPLPQLASSQEVAISAAAKELDDLRCRWLNPPEWTETQVLEFPGSVDGPWARYVVEPDARGIGTVRWPRIVPKDADCAASLKKRTLTNLYNQRPAWLDLAHKKLDAAVFAAYGWDPSMSDEELLERLLRLNLQRAEKA